MIPTLVAQLAARAAGYTKNDGADYGPVGWQRSLRRCWLDGRHQQDAFDSILDAADELSAVTRKGLTAAARKVSDVLSNFEYLLPPCTVS